MGISTVRSGVSKFVFLTACWVRLPAFFVFLADCFVRVLFPIFSLKFFTPDLFFVYYVYFYMIFYFMFIIFFRFFSCFLVFCVLYFFILLFFILYFPPFPPQLLRPPFLCVWGGPYGDTFKMRGSD